MQPEKAKKTQKRAENIGKSLSGLFHGITFLVSFFVIGPLLHEMAHIITLEVFSCTYREAIKTSFYGLYGTVEPLCNIDLDRQSIFYGSGYLTTLLAGSVLTSLSVSETENAKITRDYLASAGSGILLSMIIPLSFHGDLRILSSAYGLPDSFGVMLSLIVLITASSLGLRELEIDFDISER